MKKVRTRAPKAPPTMGRPIGGCDFPWATAVITPGVAPDVGLGEEDFRVDSGDSNGEGDDGEDVVVVVLIERGADLEEELNGVVGDSVGSVDASTTKKSRRNGSGSSCA